jgi:uncharacterized protein YehS (DUF1456 family)
MVDTYLEERRGFSDKEAYSPTMPNEIVINKKGILGKLKVAFKIENNKGEVDSIFIKYRDITKRKFI